MSTPDGHRAGVYASGCGCTTGSAPPEQSQNTELPAGGANHSVGQSVTLRTSDGSAPPAVGAFDGSGAEIGRLLDRQHDLPRRARRPWITAPIASQMTNRIHVASEVAVARPGLVMVRDVQLGVLEREAAQRLLAFGSQSDAPCSTEVCRYHPWPRTRRRPAGGRARRELNHDPHVPAIRSVGELQRCLPAARRVARLPRPLHRLDRLILPVQLVIPPPPHLRGPKGLASIHAVLRPSAGGAVRCSVLASSTTATIPVIAVGPTARTACRP